jgi:hypothetical protein
MPNDALMTSTETGVVLGVSSSTVRRMADSGQLAIAQKLPGPNGNYLFESAEVARVKAQQDEQQAAAS